MEKSFAVITGASSGIGFELARQFGEHGFDLLIASSTDDIFEAQDLLEEEGISVEAIKVNLATHKGVESLIQAIKSYERPVEAIAINAGIGLGGRFIETNLNHEINLINLNVVSVVHLTKRILPLMIENNGGKILYTSSISSQMPSPFEAVYGASKAFITSFAESIRSEVKSSGITVTVLMPGATDTNFFHRAHMDDTKVGTEMKLQNRPEEVAKQGFTALMEGRERLFAESFMTKLQGYAMKILPERAKAQIHKKWSEPGSANN